MTITFACAACVAILWVAAAHNQLFDLRARTVGAWRQVAARIRARHDLVGQLLDTTKPGLVMPAEVGGAVKAGSAACLRALDEGVPVAGVRQVARAQSALARALARFFVQIDEHPALADRQDIVELRERLSEADARVAGACQQYNDLAEAYNTRRARPLWRWIARLMEADAVEPWEAVPRTATAARSG